MNAIGERKARIIEKETGKADDGPKDSVTKFLVWNIEDPKKFTDYNILVGCMANIAAGSDTTAITLNSILYHLIKNPKSLQRLREEIDFMAAKGRISDPITFKQAQQMPYLQAVIKGGLRLHPATGLPLARVVPEGGATIAGKFFPEGVSLCFKLPHHHSYCYYCISDDVNTSQTTVGINSWVAHRNPTIYHHPGSFLPERWIPSSPTDADKVSAMDRYFLPVRLPLPFPNPTPPYLI
jgi:cytochrome P450